MAIMGQGLVLMIAGMGIVYVFLYVLILISEGASRIVSRFDDLVPDEAPRKKTRAAVPAPANASTAAPRPAAGGQPVKAPVPGTVLRVLHRDGGRRRHGEDHDPLATGDTLAMIA